MYTMVPQSQNCREHIFLQIIKEKNGKATEFQNRTEEISLGGGGFTNYISSFGEDNKGELYIVDYSGIIFKITAAE